MSADDLDAVLHQIAGFHPAVQAALQEIRAYWSPEPPPSTIAMAALARAVVKAIPETTDAEIDALARILEAPLASGPEDVDVAVATGFLEAVIASINTNPQGARLTSRLLPHARKYCQDWDTFTGCRTPGVWPPE